jgi:hypothetical protein
LLTEITSLIGIYLFPQGVARLGYEPEEEEEEEA